jgi:N-acetylneuraminic acid mutarotase
MSGNKSWTKAWTMVLTIVMLSSLILGSISTVSAYSPTWTDLAPMEMEHAQAVTVMDSANNTTYIISGGLGVGAGNYVSVTNLVSAYNVTTGDSWRVAPIPTGIRGASGGFGENGKIYVFSGSNESLGYIATTQIYDIAIDSWSTGANIPTSVWEAKCAVDWPNFYVIGGWGSFTGVQVYNAKTNSWSAGASLPDGRYCGAATYNGPSDAIFYIGGVNTSSLNAEDEVYQLVIGSSSWTRMSPLPAPTTALDATTGSDGLIYAMGGSNDITSVDPPAYSSGYYYCQNNDTWFQLPNMNTGRKFPGLVSLDDTIYVIGGNDAGSTFSSVESLQIFTSNPSLSSTTIGQGGSAWLNMSLEAFGTNKGTAVVYYIKSDSGTVYPAETHIFAAGSASTLIEIPQSMPVGSYELHAFFGVSFESGDHSFPESIFPFTIFATTSLQQQISDLQDQIAQLEQLINDINSSLSAQLNDTIANITQLQLQLAQMNANLTLFVSQIQAQIDQVNTSLVNEIAQLQLALDQAKADLASAVSLVNASLSAQLNDTLVDIAALQAQNTLLQNKITQLQNELDDLKDLMSTNDQALMDKLNLTSDQMDHVNDGFNDLNETVTNSLGSLSTNMMIGLMGVLVALLVAILVVFMSLSRKIKEIGLSQAAKGATENAEVESPDTTQPKTRTVKQKSPDQQVPPPPAPPEEKL